MKEEFKIRTMGFGELAQMYNPGIQPNSATIRLYHWIKRSQSLSRALKHSGYNKYQKILTPKMVALIVNHLGPP